MTQQRAETVPGAPFAGDARFDPREFVGSGGMGAVYRVFDRELGTEVALKTISARAADRIYRLKHEFRSLAGIIHPNLIQLHELVVRDDACFFTMDFIDGPDFVTYVREPPAAPASPERLTRFRDAASQLVRGLAALHAAGRLHRDVKPSNVRVDRAGRVVVLDFDLAAPLTAVGVQDHVEGELSGTLAYMAPEQLWGQELTPAADWYAVGIVIHEALTGRHPFDGSPADPARGPIDLEDWDPSLPSELKRLVLGLLAPEPTRRPVADTILEEIGDTSSSERTPHRISPRSGSSAFVGRDTERQRLREILTHGEQTRVVGIQGVSGIGKSELVRTALGETKGAVILAGRCHPQESVPFKALDPIIDALSRHLLSLDDDERTALWPETPRSASRLFPVLARIPGFAPEASELDDVEARRRGLASLREILRRVAETTPLVIWIDDAQWSDEDSAELLAELLLPPGAPDLCLLLTYRSEDRGEAALVRRIAELARDYAAVTFEELTLAPLNGFEAAALAGRLWPADLPEEHREKLAAEAAGSPFLLQEMGWHLATRPSRELALSDGIDFADVVRQRVSDLTPEERRLMEVLSLCGRPTERGLLLDATGLGPGGRVVVERLEGAGLLRTAPEGDGRSVETYHDRIRESVSDGLTESARRSHHRDLALCFEVSGRTAPDLLAHHFHGAGELPRASDYAFVAAERAAESLAFVRAADLFRQAREWNPGDADRQRSLRTREADALSKGARLVEGGKLFLEASLDAPRLEAFELRRRAVEDLVGADLEEGQRVFSDLLGDLDLPDPRTPQRALIGSLLRLSRIARLPFGPTAEGTPVSEEERIRIDLCYGSGVRLVDADAVRGIYFSVLSLERALHTGEATRVARSLAAVGGSISVVGGRLLGNLGRRMMRSAEQIATGLDSVELSGSIDVGLAQVDMLEGRCREALERSDRGVRILSEQCQGHVFECNFGRANALRALEELGRLAEVEARAAELRDAAIAVGNRYAETAGCQYLAIARIACGDVAGARELAARGEAIWTRHGFHIQHLYGVRIQVLCDLYAGEPGAAWERLESIQSGLRRSGLLRIPLVRTDVASLRGQTALASAARADGRARRRWRRRCERAIRRLEAESRADSRTHARLLAAGLAGQAGEGPAAKALLEEAADLADAASLTLRAACARLRLAELGDESAAIETARDEMRSCGVSEPGRWAAIYTPGFDAAASPQRLTTSGRDAG